MSQGRRPSWYRCGVRYLVIERFIHGPTPVYARAAERGRMLPDGLHYLDSWIVDDDRLDTCYQLMETDDPALLDEWIANWSDLARVRGGPGDLVGGSVGADAAPSDRVTPASSIAIVSRFTASAA